MCIKIIMRLIIFLQLYMLLKNKVALRKIYSMRNFTSDCLEKLSCHAVSGKPLALLKCTQWILPSKLAASYLTDGAKDHKAVHMGPDRMIFCTNYCSVQQ